MKKTFRLLLKVYLFTWLFVILFFCYNSFSRNVIWSKAVASFLNFSGSKTGLIVIHSLFIIFLTVFLIIRYFIRLYKKRGFKTFLKQFLLRLTAPILLIYFSISFIIQRNNQEDFNYNWNYAVENNTQKSRQLFLQDSKIRGMHVYQVGRNRSSKIKALIKSNIEWVAVIPYFYQENENTKTINVPDSVGVWSRRDSLFIKGIDQLHDKGLFVMLKPHLWMSSGWRSNINFENKEDWDFWFAGYRKNIIHYAKMAQKTNTELFCIGTELRSSLKHAPEKWIALIKEIKSIYKGKLTYAANWDDSYDFVDFWKELDYIGVQAYFPLTENASPNLEEIKNGWNTHIASLKEISEKHNKSILFTEVGYRNDIYATKTPWEWGNFFERLYKKKSDETQQLAYQALFEKLWNEPWFAGLFPWQWLSADFPIHGKPAQNTIAVGYSK